MFAIESMVGASQTGPDKRMTPLAIITAMQDCSTLWLDSEPTFTGYFRENDVLVMIVSRQVEIRRLPEFYENIRVETLVYDSKPLMGHRNTTIYGEDGEIAATSWSVGVWVSAAEGKAARIPKEIAESVIIDDKIDMEYGKRKIKLPDVEPVIAESVTAQRSDIDMNKHVNNAQYVRMAYNLLPLDFQVSGMRLEYLGQARLGDVIVPTVYEDQDRFVVVLSSGTGSTYAIVEFS